MKKLGEVIAKNRKNKGMTQQQFADELQNYGIQIKKNAISSWESDNSQPSASQFLALCQIFDINDIYTEFIGPSKMDPFKDLNEEGKEKALDYIRLLVKSGDYRPTSPEIIPFPTREMKVYYLPVSAGTGSFLDGEDYDTVTATDVPNEANFGVRVSGDSMEPRFHNEQIIWIQQTAQLENGEIGIFYLNGNAYVKKLQSNKKGTFLISLNKKYAPIPVTENCTFKIFGRVLY